MTQNPLCDHPVGSKSSKKEKNSGIGCHKRDTVKKASLIDQILTYKSFIKPLSSLSTTYNNEQKSYHKSYALPPPPEKNS